MGASGSNPNRDKARPSASPYRSDEAGVGNLPIILVVEDDLSDLFLIREAIEKTRIEAEIQVAKDGELATDFFDEADRDRLAPRPALVILDINLPKKNGVEVLQHLRNSPRCGSTPVIVVTTADSPRDRENMIRLGANSYFHKPSDYDEFLKLGEIVQAIFADHPGETKAAT